MASNIEITASSKKASKTLGDFFREMESRGQRFARVMSALDPLSGIERDARSVAGGMDSLKKSASGLDSELKDLGDSSDLDMLNKDLTKAEKNMVELHKETDDVGDGLDDASDDMRAFGKTAERESGNAESSFGKLQGRVKTFAGLLVTAFAVDKIKDFGFALAESAGSAQAVEAQFSTVFGDMEGEAAESLSAISGEASILENRMKESFTKIAAFAKTGGMNTADSLNLADRSMRAVADSAAFYDRSLEDTTESLQSFLKGN